MLIHMKSLSRQNYGGKWYLVGDTIPVQSERDASDMETLCFAERLPPQPVAEVETATRDMDAVEDAPVPAFGQQRQSKKKYNHREMHVETR